MDPAAHLDDVHDVIAALEDRGFAPILVGGMALVVLGSQRVTRDFDFVVAAPAMTFKRIFLQAASVWTISYRPGSISSASSPNCGHFLRNSGDWCAALSFSGLVHWM